MENNEIKNTLCPYLVKPLVEIDPINKEHVLPVGIGAPESFYVEASLSENSRLNDLVDAPMINDPLIKMLCMLAEVDGRSGSKAVTMHGKTELEAHLLQASQKNLSILSIKGLLRKTMLPERFW